MNPGVNSRMKANGELWSQQPWNKIKGIFTDPLHANLSPWFVRDSCETFLFEKLAFGSVLNKQCISMWEQWRGTVASGKALKITSYLCNWDFTKDQWDFSRLRPKEIVPLEAVNSCSSVISKENHSYPRSKC